MATIGEPAVEKPSRPAFQWHGPLGVALLIVTAILLLAFAAIFLAPLRTQAVAAWNWGISVEGSTARLRWLVALLPGAIILNHVVYLLSSRRKQFRDAYSDQPSEADYVDRLDDLYFGFASNTTRYVLPAILLTVLCATAIDALSNPEGYMRWLYLQPAPTAAESGTGALPPTLPLRQIPPRWPTTDWGAQTLRGAAFGFAGAYVYMLLLLTDRARRHDITTGTATWAAAMPVLGPMMGGVAALLLVSGTGLSDSSFTRDAVYFVAGMLPQQFAIFVQSGVRRLFQSGSTVALRTQPLTMVRGIGPDVEARLEEEGIHDVATLAYASPHELIHSTTYSPKQIANWIDEAMLITTVPSHWEALEKVGVTGVMDLAWYQNSPESIKPLADEIKLSEVMLRNVVARLAEDAQVLDLYRLFWDRDDRQHPLNKRPEGYPADRAPKTSGTPPTLPPGSVSLTYQFADGIEADARERLITEVAAMTGVRLTTPAGNSLDIVVDASQRDAIDAVLQAKREVESRDHK